MRHVQLLQLQWRGVGGSCWARVLLEGFISAMMWTQAENLQQNRFILTLPVQRPVRYTTHIYLIWFSLFWDYQHIFFFSLDLRLYLSFSNSLNLFLSAIAKTCTVASCICVWLCVLGRGGFWDEGKLCNLTTNFSLIMASLDTNTQICSLTQSKTKCFHYVCALCGFSVLWFYMFSVDLPPICSVISLMLPLVTTAQLSCGRVMTLVPLSAGGERFRVWDTAVEEPAPWTNRPVLRLP